MKLGLQLGYWGAQPNPFAVALAQEAERLEYDSVWTAEAWGSDAFTPLAWIGAHTERIRLCTGIVQISARTPASCAMHALTLDHLSNGRFTLGLGVSGPQVVEGWYGQPFGKPLGRTREYVDILRRVLKREEPVAFAGEHFRMPYDGPGAWGLGKPLRSLTHPLRADGPRRSRSCRPSSPTRSRSSARRSAFANGCRLGRRARSRRSSSTATWTRCARWPNWWARRAARSRERSWRRIPVAATVSPTR